jgi:hypothetical protein
LLSNNWMRKKHNLYLSQIFYRVVRARIKISDIVSRTKFPNEPVR